MAEKTPDKSSNDIGQAEVQKKMDEDTDKGYHGVVADPLPNSAYSLESGPDSPTAVESRSVALKAELSELDATKKES